MEIGTKIRPALKPGRRTLMNIALTVLFAVPFLLTAQWLWRQPVSTENGMDFHLFWVAGDISRAGDWDNIYLWKNRPDIRAAALQNAELGHMTPRLQEIFGKSYNFYPTATPFLYTLFDLTKVPDFETALRRYQAFAIACYCAGLFILCRLFRISYLETALIGFIWPRFMWPYLGDLYWGNVNGIQVMGIALFAALRFLPASAMREILSGLWITILIAFKPNLLFGGAAIGLLWLSRKGWRDAALLFTGVIAGALIALVLPMLTLGKSCSWLSWIDGMRQTVPYHARRDVGDLHLPGFWLVNTMILFVIAVGPSLWNELRFAGWGENSDRTRQECLLFGMGPAIFVLTVPLFYYHYYTLLAPLFIALLPSANSGLNESRVYRLLKRVLLAGVYFLLCYHREAVLGWAPPNRVPEFAGAALLFVLGTLDLVSLCSPRFRKPEAEIERVNA